MDQAKAPACSPLPRHSHPQPRHQRRQTVSQPPGSSAAARPPPVNQEDSPAEEAWALPRLYSRKQKEAWTGECFLRLCYVICKALL